MSQFSIPQHFNKDKFEITCVKIQDLNFWSLNFLIYIIKITLCILL